MSQLPDIKSITLPESVLKINDFAFAGNEAVETITIGNQVNSIRINPFVNCSSLVTIEFNGKKQFTFSERILFEK